MRRSGLLALGLTLSFLTGARADAPANLTPAQIESARGWVRQLGDRAFKAREEATKNLLALGRAAIPLLEEAVKDSDAEVRRRGGELLTLAQRSDTEVALAEFIGNRGDAKLLKLPSWTRFSKTVGTDDAAKRLFVELYCAEGSMLVELDRNPKDFNVKFNEYCRKVQQEMYTPWGVANPPSHSQVVALLFMAMDPVVSKDVQSFYLLSNLFWQPTVQQGFQADAGSRKILLGFLEQRNNAQTAQQVFNIARQMKIKEAVPMALKTIHDKAANGYTRGMALLFIGQMGDRSHAKELEKLLEDTTVLGTVQTGTARISAQMRDLALAALIMTSGQNINDYEFPYMQQFRGFRGDLHLPPYYYGFSDDAGRDAAFKKWRDSQKPAEKKK